VNEYIFVINTLVLNFVRNPGKDKPLSL